jgi:hypothetical protein
VKVNKRLALGAAAVAAAAIAIPASARTGASGGDGSQACTNQANTADGTVKPSVTSLWPPNHKMHTVTISYTAPGSDVPNDASSIKITGIIDDQANADGSGEVQGSGAPTDVQGLDWSGIGNSGTAPEGQPASTTVQLRAERSGLFKAGRTYTIMVSCGEQDAGSGVDNPGESGTASVTVTVPHDQGH